MKELIKPEVEGPENEPLYEAFDECSCHKTICRSRGRFAEEESDDILF